MQIDRARTKTYKHFWGLYVLALLSALGWATMGYSYAVYNSTLFHIIKIMDWPSNEIAFRKGLVVGIFPGGAIITLILTILKFSNLSRRSLLVCADTLTIIGASLTMISNFWIFLVGRLFLGFAYGINAPIVPVFIRENAPPEISGKRGGAVGLNTTFGL